MILSLLSSLLDFFRKKKALPSIRNRESEDSDLDSLISKTKVRLEKFLITRSASSGLIKKTKEWSFSRSGEGLYKLEGESFSVLIYTEGFLTEKAGKLTGLVHIPESDLCKALHANESAAALLSRADSLTEKSREVLARHFNIRSEESVHPPSIDDIADWDDFDVYQTLIRVSPNTVAHVLLHASPESSAKIRSQMSERYKDSIILELQTLLSGGSDINPHSKIRSLTESDAALEEFRKQMQNVLHKKYVRQSSKLLSS